MRFKFGRERVVRLSIVAGNWKMHGSLAANQKLLEDLKHNLPNTTAARCIVFPPYVYLPQVCEILQNSAISWGAQNINDHQQGAYTGEISAAMLQDFGCSHVLVGHSERRVLFHETDELIAQKFIQAQQQGLTPVLCVGETLQQREQGLTNAVISKQLNALLKLENGVHYFRKAYVAYEPVWAIGTGVSASAEQAQLVHEFIRHEVAAQDAAIGVKIPILYGGSVKASNAQALFAMPDIDGGLVGGAALDAAEFVEIIRCIK